MPIISFFMLVFIISFRRKISHFHRFHDGTSCNRKLCPPDKDFIGRLMAELLECFFCAYFKLFKVFSFVGAYCGRSRLLLAGSK